MVQFDTHIFQMGCFLEDYKVGASATISCTWGLNVRCTHWKHTSKHLTEPAVLGCMIDRIDPLTDRFLLCVCFFPMHGSLC